MTIETTPYTTVGQTLYAEVALDLPLERSFHYLVPQAMIPVVKAGMRAEVPFGGRTISGYIVRLVNESPVQNLKSLAALLDSEPIISDELFALASWLSKRYLCSLGEALSTVIPSAIKAPRRPAVQHTVAEAAPAEPSKAPVFTEGQRQVFGVLKASIDARKHEVFLLHGVTSSGKTEVYLAAIEEVLKLGRSAIFLLPEISLTPQFVGIVRKRFPGKVGLWHSQVSAGEKYRTWQAARAGKIRIILGARSAVFAPFTDLGLIVIDEEHEPSYKQEQKPTYQTRDVAAERARLHNAAVVLGSATPSLETYYRAREGGFTLLELPERVDSRMLPPVKVIELRELTKKSRVISPPLLSALERVLARREQAIIFLNRRGFAPGIMCHSCGQVWQCPRCAISLVYHREPEGLRCHYCDYHEAWPGTCPSCGQNNLAIFGVGTQKVEQELKKLFPQGRILRLDRDTTSRKGVYEQVYEDFKNENVDILIGTQMIAKGFDFPRVTLVGVIDADTALYLPDYHSSERTFQLITQVAGRCGRSSLGGEVIVQTRHPQHYAMRASQKHDYREFYEQELSFRRQMHYPPYCRLVNLLLRGKKEEKVAECAQAVAADLGRWKEEHKASYEVLGPTPAAHAKLRGQFRWQILLKGSLEEMLPAVGFIRNYPLRGGVLMSVDVDPQVTL